MHYETLDAFVADLPIHAQRHAEQLKGHDVTAVLETKEGRVVNVVLRNGEITMPDVMDGKVDCRVIAGEADLLDMINGKLNPAKAILFRKIVVKGDVGKIMALIRIM